MPRSKANKLLYAPYIKELKSSLILTLRREHAIHLGRVRKAAVKHFNEISTPIRVIGASTKELRYVSLEMPSFL